MSTLQRRFFRHDADAGNVRELHSFLTCRLVHSIPFSAREQLMTYRGNCEQRHGAVRSPFPVDPSTQSVLRDVAGRFAAPAAGGFEQGFTAELFSFWDMVLGSSPGPGWLRHPRIADAAQQSLHALDGVLCRIEAFVVLPTHVHIAFSQNVGLRDGPTPEHVSGAFKAPVEHQANRFLVRSGPFWEQEDHHRFLPGPADLRGAIRFIREDPVRSGLVEKPEEWEWLYVREGWKSSLCRSS
ncbi:MAG: hypothetical protein IH600_01905 [Bacteroidetes bacterium]|nr:hypothetical protein [Bacteroidota bacterium]